MTPPDTRRPPPAATGEGLDDHAARDRDQATTAVRQRERATPILVEDLTDAPRLSGLPPAVAEVLVEAFAILLVLAEARAIVWQLNAVAGAEFDRAITTMLVGRAQGAA